VVRLGGEVWAVEGYDPETSDFNAVVQKLLAASKPGKGDSGFDALFIPDVGPKVRRLVPFLKYWGVLVKTDPRGRGVQLLGASGWNHPSVIDRGDNLTDNAVFADAFFYDPDDPAVDAFGTAFYLAQKEKPRPFHAEVFDATGLLAPLVAAVPGADHQARVEVLRRLLGTRNHPGVTGLMTVLPDGTVLKAPRILTIDLDDIRLRLADEEEDYVRKHRVAPEGQ
ncbi:MAG: ABC transporter substrate-binding protein, partial [Myxococcales bacterium]|nr:ABC transporter substrate-binding protein [Myxococcales bacterium]